MGDFISELLAFLFAQDKKEHPMPHQEQNRLWEKIKSALHGSEAN